MKLTSHNIRRIQNLVDATYRERIVMHTFWTIVLTCAVIVTGIMITHLVSARYATPQETLSVPTEDFGCAIEPFGLTPRWGVMRSDAELERTFCEIPLKEFIQPLAYDIESLQIPLAQLNDDHSEEARNVITSKLFYSTRHFGLYDLDSDEYVSSDHPGMDFKMPKGTPVSAIAGGPVEIVLATHLSHTNRDTHAPK